MESKILFFAVVLLMAAQVVMTFPMEAPESKTEHEIEKRAEWWCIWIPEPVKSTLPACQGRKKRQIAPESKTEQDVEERQIAPESKTEHEIEKRAEWWCIWIPEPVKSTLPACQGRKKRQIAPESKTEHEIEKRGKPNNVWCKWIPEPVRITLPDCRAPACSDCA